MEITVLVFTAALFLAMVMSMASKPKILSRINGFILAFVAVSGIVLYSLGYAQTVAASGNTVTAILRATLAVCGMFLGKNDWSVVSSAPLFAAKAMVVYFWFVHMLALYLMASAAIAAVGAEALKKLRLLLARRGKLILIYGADPEAIQFGASLNSEKDASVVFISESVTADMSAAIAKAGAILRSEPSAVHPAPAFLRSLGIKGGRRRLEIYAIDNNENENLRFAEELRDCLEKAGVRPEQTSITVIGSEQAIGGRLDAGSSQYGYGSVSIFHRPDLPARQLVLQYPPYRYMTFDENGRAKTDFICVIIGFGTHGQSVLKELIMNGQFEGSTFHAAVFAPHCLDAAGYFQQEAPGIFENYDIEFHDCDGRSAEVFRYLWQNRNTVRYVAVCAGPESANREIASQLVEYYWRHGIPTPVFQCWHFGVRTQSAPGAPVIATPSYSRECLSAAYSDAGAMALNHMYTHSQDTTAQEDWKHCDHFSRMSSRASADFVPAFLKMAGRTEEEAMAGWELSPAMLETLGRTEHLRWCAFHYAMGFSRMEDAEWEERAKAYEEEVRQTGSSSVRISKYLPGRTHACLIPWEDLSALDERESAVTGKPCCYQQADIDNINTIPQMLRILKEQRP